MLLIIFYNSTPPPQCFIPYLNNEFQFFKNSFGSIWELKSPVTDMFVSWFERQFFADPVFICLYTCIQPSVHQGLNDLASFADLFFWNTDSCHEPYPLPHAELSQQPVWDILSILSSQIQRQTYKTRSQREGLTISLYRGAFLVWSAWATEPAWTLEGVKRRADDFCLSPHHLCACSMFTVPSTPSLTLRHTAAWRLTRNMFQRPFFFFLHFTPKKWP